MITIVHNFPTEISITVQVTNEINAVLLPNWYVLEIDPALILNDEIITAHGPYTDLSEALSRAETMTNDIESLDWSASHD